MEAFELKGWHVLTGKEFQVLFLLRRRKGQRPIDAILDVFDLGGVHVTSIKKVPTRRLPKVIPLQIEGDVRLIGRK